MASVRVPAGPRIVKHSDKKVDCEIPSYCVGCGSNLESSEVGFRSYDSSVSTKKYQRKYGEHEEVITIYLRGNYKVCDSCSIKAKNHFKIKQKKYDQFRVLTVVLGLLSLVAVSFIHYLNVLERPMWIPELITYWTLVAFNFFTLLLLIYGFRGEFDKLSKEVQWIIDDKPFAAYVRITEGEKVILNNEKFKEEFAKVNSDLTAELKAGLFAPDINRGSLKFHVAVGIVFVVTFFLPRLILDIGF
ncbi:MAG: hypothetical protein ACFFED_05005 [Candidatus Thorarchaeota archaeon]